MGIENQQKYHKKMIREKKKRRQLCMEMQIRGWIIYLVAFLWDFIAINFNIHHAPGVSWGQAILAFYGLWLVWMGEKSR